MLTCNHDFKNSQKEFLIKIFKTNVFFFTSIFYEKKKIKFVWKRSTNYWLKVVFKSTINNEPITRSITAVKRKEEIWIDLQ